MSAGWVVLCLGIHALFSAADAALAHASRSALEESATRGDSGAQMALRMAQDPSDRLMATVRIGANASMVAGITVLGLAFGAAGVPQPWLWAGLYLPVALVFSESLPRLLARANATAWAAGLAPLLYWVQIVLTPILFATTLWTAGVRRLLPQESAPIHREDIVQMLDDGQKHSIDPEDRAFIRRLLALSEITAEEAMTPLVEVQGIDEDATAVEAVRVILESGHSRLPVYRDRVDNIVGRIELMDLLGASDDAPVRDLVRTVPFVPDSKRADVLLREMREERHSFAAVVDEYGGSVGIVTMEDLLEQVVGDIVDERDHDVPGIRRLGDNEWRVPARVAVEDLEEAIGRPLPAGDYETVAGLLLSVTGRIPKEGAQIRVGRLTFHVDAASERAVHLVRVTDAPP